MASLSLKNINKIYAGNVQAVYDFNIEIANKEFIVFVGPSGCGKSTTLRMIAGLEDISSGELYIDNEFMNNVEPKDRNIAMVFQSYALYPHMTVYENIKFALKLRRLPFPIWDKEANKEEIEALLKEKAVLRKSIRKCLKKVKKGKMDDETRAERDVLYAQLYELENKISSLRVQVTGYDEYQVYCLGKKIKEIEKKIDKTLKVVEKYPEREAEVTEQVTQLNKTKAYLEEKLAYLENNDVPLFKYRKPTRDEMDLEINKIAEQIDLVPYLSRKPAALSGGQRQRVALGRAMVRKPKVFLMDEPLSNLDAKLRVQTRNEIRKLHNNVGATTIYVTHDQIEAMTMADRIVVMKDGWIQQIGTPHEVFNNPANKFVGGFIGSTPMNFISATYKEGSFYFVTADNQTVSFPAAEAFKSKLSKTHEGQEVIIGIRPGDIYLDIDPEKQNPTESFECKVDTAELIGTELLVHTNLEGMTLVVKVRYEEKVLVGKSINICLDTEKLYVFDKDSELRIA